MNSPIERLTKKEERSGFLMATLDEDELYAVQNFIAGMKATKEYVKMQEKEKEKAENPEQNPGVVMREYTDQEICQIIQDYDRIIQELRYGVEAFVRELVSLDSNDDWLCSQIGRAHV